MIEGVALQTGQLENNTSAQGIYAFANMTMFRSYEISASKNDDLLNGVTAVDMVLIQRHILGKQKIASPYLQIAADVNSDGRISALDLVVLRNAILGRSDEFIDNTSWRFVDALHNIPDNLAPYDETVNIDNLNGNIDDANFIGIKIGDINNNVISNSLISGGRSYDLHFFTVKDQAIKKGQEISVPITVEDIQEIRAFQFTMSTEHLSLIDIYSDAIDINRSHIAKHSDAITVAWNESIPLEEISSNELFILNFLVHQDGSLSDFLQINSSITKALVYRDLNEDIDLGLTFDAELQSVISRNHLYQNVPNPFSGETTIGFELGQSGQAIVSFYDIAGQKILEIKDNYNMGYNEVTIDADLLKRKGVIIYKLEQGGYSDYKRMIRID